MTTRYQLNLLEPAAQLLSKWLTEDESARLASGLQAVYEAARKITATATADGTRPRRPPARTPACEHEKSCVINAIRGLIHSFVMAYGVKVGAGLLSLVLASGRTPWRRLQRNAIRALLGRDTLSFAAFISLFVGGYKSLLCLQRRAGVPVRAGAFAAGAAAGAALLVDRNHDRRVAVALYVSVRVAHFCGRWLFKHYIEPSAWVQNARLAAGARGGHRPRKSVSRVRRIQVSVQRRPSDEDGVPSAPTLAPPLTTIGEAASASSDSDDGAPPHPPPAHHRRSDATLAQRQLMRRAIAPLIMAAASAQIFAAFQIAPETLPAPYLSFLFTHSGVRGTHGRFFKEAAAQIRNAHAASCAAVAQHLHLGRDAVTARMSSYPVLRQLSGGALDLTTLAERQLVQTMHPDGPHDPFVTCNTLHYWTPSCNAFAGHLLWSEFGRALKLYGALYAVITLLFRYRALARDPVRVGRSYVLSTVRSAVFLALFVAIAGAAGCYLRRFALLDRTWVFYASGALAGALALPVETPMRQLEIAYYCLPRGIESLWRQLVAAGWVSAVPVYRLLRLGRSSPAASGPLRGGSGGEAVLFVAASGLMMMFYQCEANVVTSGYRSILGRIIGVN